MRPEARPPRIALYGGSFDPPHICHVLAATWVLCREDVDELRVVPVFQHAFGKRMAPFELRCAMIEAAMAHLGPRIRVDRVEQRRGGTSYTIDTVEALLAEHPGAELAFVGGTDLFRDRHRWKRWDDLQRLMRFIILGRDGEPDPPGATIAARLPPVSSTDIRARIASGQPVGHLVPPGALDLIEAHGLYR